MIPGPFKALISLLLVFVVSSAHAEPFRDGVVAYQQKKYQQALHIWLPLAESGHVLAQTLVGSMYAYGEGIERNDEQAFKWLSRAAEYGSAQAQFNLAILYENGFGTDKDIQQALKWFKTAAAQGRKDAAARYELLFNHDSSTQHELLGPPDTPDTGATWMQQQPENNYTIQLAASIEPRLIEAFKASIKLSSNYADTTSMHNGRQWYAVIYGSYPTVREAKQAIASFPDNWKTWQPWIKKFSSVKHIQNKTDNKKGSQ